MGCNYYLVTDPCPDCHRGEDKIHLGKFSMGWAFSFRGYHAGELPDGQVIENFEDWEKFIWKNGEVQDEYGDREVTQLFIDRVKDRTGLHHAEQCDFGHSSMVGGRSFTFSEFS